MVRLLKCGHNFYLWSNLLHMAAAAQRFWRRKNLGGAGGGTEGGPGEKRGWTGDQLQYSHTHQTSLSGEWLKDATTTVHLEIA